MDFDNTMETFRFQDVWFNRQFRYLNLHFYFSILAIFAFENILLPSLHSIDAKIVFIGWWLNSRTSSANSFFTTHISDMRCTFMNCYVLLSRLLFLSKLMKCFWTNHLSLNVAFNFGPSKHILVVSFSHSGASPPLADCWWSQSTFKVLFQMVTLAWPSQI